MFSAILRAPFARPLFLSSVSRFTKSAVTARPLLLLEARRTFLTTASLAAKAETTKEEKPKKVTEIKKPKAKKATKSKQTKAKKATKVKATKAKKAPKAKKIIVKKVKVLKPKEPRVLKKDLKIPHKRPNTSWQDFYYQYISEHKEPGDTFTSSAVAASAIWKTMSAEEKAKYGASEEERAEYKKLAAEHRSTSVAFKRAVKKLRKPRKRDAPLGAYNVFVKENYDKTSPLSFQQQGSELGKQWKETSLVEKEAYKQRGIELYEQSKVATAAAEVEN